MSEVCICTWSVWHLHDSAKNFGSFGRKAKFQRTLAYVKNSTSQYIAFQMPLVKWLLRWLNLNSFLCIGVSCPELFLPWSLCHWGCVAVVACVPGLSRKASSFSVWIEAVDRSNCELCKWCFISKAPTESHHCRCEIWWRSEEAELCAGFCRCPPPSGDTEQDSLLERCCYPPIHLTVLFLDEWQKVWAFFRGFT